MHLSNVKHLLLSNICFNLFLPKLTTHSKDLWINLVTVLLLGLWFISVYYGEYMCAGHELAGVYAHASYMTFVSFQHTAYLWTIRSSKTNWKSSSLSYMTCTTCLQVRGDSVRLLNKNSSIGIVFNFSVIKAVFV